VGRRRPARSRRAGVARRHALSARVQSIITYLDGFSANRLPVLYEEGPEVDAVLGGVDGALALADLLYVARRQDAGCDERIGRREEQAAQLGSFRLERGRFAVGAAVDLGHGKDDAEREIGQLEKHFYRDLGELATSVRCQ
jgi:hypothetical protein